MKAKEIDNRLIIPIGLPGSGKTFYGITTLKKYRKKNYVTFHCDCDGYINIAKDMDDLLCKSTYKKTLNHKDVFYIDGPWFSEKSVLDVVKYFFKWNNIKKVEIKHLDFVYWNLDRETCMSNDDDRREQSSKSTIKNHPFMKITDEFLEKVKEIINDYDMPDCEVNVGYRDVYKMDYIDKVVRDKGFNYDPTKNEFYSETWSLGGEWGNCWGDSGTIEPEKPLDFKELDELLLELVPNISYLQYKNLFNKVADTVTSCDHGYYGTYEDKCQWVCNIDVLRNVLKELGLNVKNC